MGNFLNWLAKSPEATVLKVALGAALGALLSWLMSSDIHHLVVAIGAAVLPVCINYLTGRDLRYGHKDEIDA